MIIMIIQKIINILIVTQSLAMVIIFVLMMTLRNAIRTMGRSKDKDDGGSKDKDDGGSKDKDDGGSKDKDDVNNGSSSRCPNGQTKSPSGDCEKLYRIKVCLGVQTGHIELPMELDVKKSVKTKN